MIRSGIVAREQRAHRQPLPEKELFQIQSHHLSLGCQCLGDKDLNTLGFELAIGLQIDLACVSVD